MIKNKNQFKIALKNGNVKNIKRIYNFDNDNKIKEGSVGVITHVQSNAYTVKWDCLEKDTWAWFDTIEVVDNKIIYYQYIPDYYNINEIKEKLSHYKYSDLISVSDDDKINNDFKKVLRNWKYAYKYIAMINEIIESEEDIK